MVKRKRTKRGPDGKGFKYIRMGDIGLMEHEARKGDNLIYIISFLMMTIVLALTTAFACYLTYTFSSAAATACFLIVIIALFFDILLFRNLVLLFWGLIIYCKRRRKL